MRAPSSTLAGLGYDDLGNAPHLLHPDDKAKLDRGEYNRRGGANVHCPVCDVPYWMHPPVQGALFIIRGCDQLVKL